MINPVHLKNILFAPCGMNWCSLHIFEIKTSVPVAGSKARIKQSLLNNVLSQNVVICKIQDQNSVMIVEKYPCQRIKNLDKRYRTKYRTSFIDNLTMVKEKD